ncbi:MAG: ABC transporter permease subunit [Ilumatobacter sp.]|uniref:ABC transporter permease n=1 Tax=Ilumatobacter sp. TaxID=1967498 RepID=UPI0026064977|nr:ABC transporter permease subunit [Ilumatobacter sp.]MDJ0771585.1 ABC transporter permease subunit [Ilumatobacter sp.]
MIRNLRNSAAFWAVVGALVLGVVWEAFVRLRDVRKFVLLPPSEIVETFADNPGFYLDNIWVTARHMLIGLAISLAVSVAFGALLAAVRPLEQASQPLLVLILVTPWVAYISSVVLWLGAGGPSIIFLVAFVTVPAFVYATVGGMRSADPAARELFASIDASRLEVLWRLRLPAAMPSLFTAARFNVGLGLAAAYFAEGAAFATDGLGEAGKRAASFNEGSILWTTILCAAVLGIAGQVVVVLLERWLLHWHASQRAQSTP